MLSRSPEFDATVAEPHVAISSFELLDGEQVVESLDVSDFTVSADAKAAQTCSVTAVLAGTDDNIPATIADRLGPGGTRARASRGVRIQNIVAIGGPIVSAAGWTPTTDYGVLNGVVADADGAIRLGP